MISALDKIFVWELVMAVIDETRPLNEKKSSFQS